MMEVDTGKPVLAEVSASHQVLWEECELGLLSAVSLRCSGKVYRAVLTAELRTEAGL